MFNKYKRNSENKIKTMLTAHVWELKDNGTDHNIKWDFIDRAPSFNPDTRNPDNRIKTKLSGHVWELKNKGTDHNIKLDFKD